MKILLGILGIFIFSGAMAACPSSPIKTEEVHLDNFVLVGNGQECPTGTVEYFDINEMCDAHIY